MTVFLVIMALLTALLSVGGVTGVTAGVWGIGVACLLAILARVSQANDQHRKLLRALAAKSIVPLLLLSVGCRYVPPPTAPTVTPPVIVVENPPPALPPPTPITLLLSPSRTENFAGEGLSLRALPISGEVFAPATYTFTFGDGTTDTTTANFAGHVYQQPGSYAATVSVRDRDGRTADASTTVEVRTRPAPPREPRDPVQGIGANMTCTAGDVGDNTGCNVRASYKGSTLPPSAIQRVDWEWGDGETTLDGRPAENHEYQVAGQYQVWADLTVSTSDGTKKTSATAMVTVEP